MKKETDITQKLTDVLAKEKKKFAKKENSLFETCSKFSKMGIDMKTTYTLPPKDTIGKTFNEQIQFKNI